MKRLETSGVLVSGPRPMLVCRGKGQPDYAEFLDLLHEQALGTHVTITVEIRRWEYAPGGSITVHEDA